MASITRKGAGWFVQIRRKGYPPQFKTFPSKAEAIAWAGEQECRINRHEAPVDLRTLRATTLGDVVRRYVAEVTPRKRSAATEALRLGKLSRTPFCNLSLAELTSQAVAAYRDERLLTVRPGTVRRELSLVQHAIDTARKEWGYGIAVNPVKSVSLPSLRNARSRRLAAGEFDRLVQAMAAVRNPLIQPAVLLAIETGMRRGEILSLLWRNIDFTIRTAHIPETKTGKPRTIPLTDGAIAILRSLPVSELRAIPLNANALKLAWVRICRRAQLADLHFHDLRHEAISRFFELGLSVPEVALISGHRDPRMLFRYTHLRPYELARKLTGMAWEARVHQAPSGAV